VLAYALHHGLAKGALFLSTAVVAPWPATRLGGVALGAGLVLPALAIAGLPATSGAAAKTGLKQAFAPLPAVIGSDPAQLLGLGAAATALLMVRFLFVLRGGAPGHGAGQGARAWWSALVALVVVLPWVGGPLRGWVAKGLAPEAVAMNLLPVAAAVLLGLAAIRAARHLPMPPPVPAGDLYTAIEAAVVCLARPTARIRRRLGSLWRPRNRVWSFVYHRLWLPGCNRLTAADRWSWTTSGTAFLLILVLLAALLSRTLGLGPD
jgi:hypothetical protein